MSHTAASRPGSRKAFLKNFENVSESGLKSDSRHAAPETRGKG
jgi:hypothetical protein